jgi:hypothetical protein
MLPVSLFHPAKAFTEANTHVETTHVTQTFTSESTYLCDSPTIRTRKSLCALYLIPHTDLRPACYACALSSHGYRFPTSDLTISRTLVRSSALGASIQSMPLIVQTCSTCLRTTISTTTGFSSSPAKEIQDHVYPQHTQLSAHRSPSYPVQSPPPFSNTTRFNATTPNMTSAPFHDFNSASHVGLSLVTMFLVLLCSIILLR